ncbi:uncharacterized protein LOC105396442 [Plutella xylostella]|uniref:uncharacterized protein LOC105396442 n=1 Tax=Plutella xylostella TaxID=51655 RepID=UPI00203257E9|nr:uncharacterized protein LOC105396442 [Plutella xylostella]
MMGYEEFHRASWYRKVASFVDNIGCATESQNFLQTSQRVRLNKEYPSHILEIIENRLRSHLMNDRCHEHVITLSMVMMAQAIRHSLFHLKKKPSGENLTSTSTSTNGRSSTKITRKTPTRLKKLNPTLIQRRQSMMVL